MHAGLRLVSGRTASSGSEDQNQSVQNSFSWYVPDAPRHWSVSCYRKSVPVLPTPAHIFLSDNWPQTGRFPGSDGLEYSVFVILRHSWIKPVSLFLPVRQLSALLQFILYCFISNFSNYILTYLIASCKHLFCFYKKFACLTHQRKIVKNAWNLEQIIFYKPKQYAFHYILCKTKISSKNT